VNRKSTPPIPESIVQLRRQLDQFRSTPTATDEAAGATVASSGRVGQRQHGIYPVAHPLRLDYMGLKRRVGGVPALRRKASKPSFVELTAPHALPLAEYAIDCECPSGRKMRIQWKASAPHDWVSLLRAGREMEG